MRSHVIFSVVLTTICFLPPLQAAAQAVSIYGPDLAARECYDFARKVVDYDEIIPFSLGPCTRALTHGKLAPRDQAGTYINRGILNAAFKDYPRAIRDYEAARELYPSFGAIYVNRGNIFFLRESYDTAIVEYSKALEAEMIRYQVAYLNRGMAHENLGHFQKAESDYRRALRLAPNWAIAETKLARVLGKMN